MKSFPLYTPLLFLAATVLFSCTSNVTTPLEIGENTVPDPAVSGDIAISAAQFTAANMKLGALREYTFSREIRTNGRLDVPPKQNVRISAYAGGYVHNIDLLPGERVRKGQRLFTLENPAFVQMQQDYLEAKEQLSFLQSDYERQKTLAEENIASQKNFLKAESDYRVTRARMEGLKKRMSLLKIPVESISVENLVSEISVYAPISGYITEVRAFTGMYLNPTDVAVELVDTDHLHLELNVFEKDLMDIKKGQKILFRLPDASERTFEGEVFLVGKSVQEENRIIRIHGHLTNEKEGSAFVPGMYVEGRIITNAHQAPGLPESAVISLEGQDFVLVRKGTENYTFEKRTVQIGQRENGIVELLNPDDFGPNAQFLLEGAFNLLSEE